MEDRSILKGLSDLSDTALDAAALVQEPKKTVAQHITHAYWKSAYAVATAAPLSLILSGNPTISQTPARQPETDPHVPSQTQNSVLLEMSRMTVATTTAASSNVAVVRFSDK